MRRDETKRGIYGDTQIWCYSENKDDWVVRARNIAPPHLQKNSIKMCYFIYPTRVAFLSFKLNIYSKHYTTHTHAQKYAYIILIFYCIYCRCYCFCYCCLKQDERKESWWCAHSFNSCFKFNLQVLRVFTSSSWRWRGNFTASGCWLGTSFLFLLFCCCCCYSMYWNCCVCCWLTKTKHNNYWQL